MIELILIRYLSFYPLINHGLPLNVFTDTCSYTDTSNYTRFDGSNLQISSSGAICFNANNASRAYINNGTFTPTSDNSLSLRQASYTWSVVYSSEPVGVQASKLFFTMSYIMR
jgi:hypothetical protein